MRKSLKALFIFETILFTVLLGLAITMICMGPTDFSKLFQDIFDLNVEDPSQLMSDVLTYLLIGVLALFILSLFVALVSKEDKRMKHQKEKKIKEKKVKSEKQAVEVKVEVQAAPVQIKAQTVESDFIKSLKEKSRK